ncbi:MAG TPA: hypothetical protein VGI39_08995 [Polyangiaceae bacterium]
MSALESSITLEDVFVVVGAKRVPLAPELAGYLTLEIAEGAAQAAGEVDPRNVYIGEEGSVALVRPRREAPSGDTEGSIRTILARLLEVSGAHTQALASAARRKPSTGIDGLVEELEAALIPVNRAAGRRALARLAREVKRVTLGVGRNAPLAPGEPPREHARRASSPAHASMREEPRASVREPEPPPPPPQMTPPPPAAQAARGIPDPSELPTRELRRSAFSAPAGGKTPPPPTTSSGGEDEVDHLLASFGVSSRGEQAARNELKALVGLEPTPPPPGSAHPGDSPAAPPAHPSHDSELESLLALSESAPPVARVATGAPPQAALASPPTAISPRLATEPYSSSSRAAAPPAPATPPAEPSPRMRPELPSHNLATSPSARRLAELQLPPRDRTPLIFAVLIVLAGVAAIVLLRPSILGGHESAPSASASPVAPVPTTPPPPACTHALVVQNAPTNAEILVRVGQAPVDVDHMPVGPRLEFVATAEGFAPKRATVPAGTSWDTGSDGKPRYEVAVQLDPSRARSPGAVDPWPPGEPGSEIGGKGAPGTVHLVTTPRGAEVWLLAGLGPEARIDQLPCNGDVEVLVAGPTSLRKRLRIPDREFVSSDGGSSRTATVSAK